MLQDGRGYVRLKAMARRMTLTAQGELYPTSHAPQPRWAEVSWDPDERLDTFDASLELKCVLIARLSDYLDQGVPTFEIGLVLAKVGGHNRVWARLGLFNQPRDRPVPLFPDDRDEVEQLTHTTVIV